MIKCPIFAGIPYVCGICAKSQSKPGVIWGVFDVMEKSLQIGKMRKFSSEVVKPWGWGGGT